MQTREIPFDQWDAYLDDFNRAHAGQTVRMETRLPGGEGEIACDNIPLLGITPERGETESDRPRTLAITTGNLSARQQHTVNDPTRVWVAESGGTQTAIQIEGRDGTITLLHLSVMPGQAMSHDFPIEGMQAN